MVIKMSERNDMYQKIREFLLKVSRKKELSDDEDIFEGGIVNSLFAMQLVLFLEKHFNIRIQGSELNKNNFRNINTIIKFLEDK